MPDDPRTHGLWRLTAPAGPDCQPLQAAATADVVVVGAGYTGLAAALRLAEAGASVRVVEAGFCGYGGSGRNVGLVNAGLWIMPDDLPAILGPVYGERLLQLLGNAPSVVFDLVQQHGMDCEAVRNGTLHCAVGSKGQQNLAQRASQWQARGAPVQLLNAAEAGKMTGAKGYCGALLDLRAGTIQPLSYARGLAQAALRAGVALHEASPVRAVRRAGSQWRVETEHGSIEALWVVMATNAYSSGVFEQLRTELLHLPYFNIATRPLPAALAQTILPGRQGCWDTREILTSFRLDAANRLIIGSVGALRGTGGPVHRRWARASLQRLFPQLAQVEFEAQWYGMIGMTSDALPRFHQLAERIISFSGYNGRGIAPGTVFGQAMADHIAGKIPQDMLPLPLSVPETRPFRPLREAFYEYGAQVAHLTSRI
ncbi:FAD-binding oxidoreductase [Aureimonas fodinaquatilis]|uniref:FAD-binding oxidoreductase n=1 Tax=Aureimonas fodinaquatilis TaxID=2565783 RepID=A0A5B0DSC9_9HYPH|nr:FAD-binding oxidoreductase [Aureimonas fodinaquatilis]KAA0969348.1 FAD-binding oxidoreductase [Aureimonas fodinaquatilis]